MIDHKAATGNPPAQAKKQDVWELVEGFPERGIQACHRAGKKYYRAVAALQDERYPGKQGPVSSREFEACDEADMVQVDALSFINPMAEQHRREIAAAVARSHMDPAKQAAMSDMRKVVADLEADLLYPYKAWQMEQERRRARKAASDAMVAQLLQLDKEFLTPEQLVGLAERGIVIEGGKS